MPKWADPWLFFYNFAGRSASSFQREAAPPRAEQKSGGGGAEKCRFSPVRGWVKDRRKEWRDWRANKR